MKKTFFLLTLLCICLQKAVFAIPTYTCGYQKDNSNTSIATLWIENNGQVKTVSLTDGSSPSQAYKILIYQNKLFIIGYNGVSVTSKATLWKADLLGNNVEEIKFGLDGSKGLDVSIYNNQLYVVGARTIESISVACLWKLDLNGVILSENIFETSVSNAYSISIGSNKLIIGGDVEIPNKAALWIGDVSGNNISRVYTNINESNAYSTLIYKNQLYLVGAEKDLPINSLKATLWTSNLYGSSIKAVTLSYQESSCYNISVFNKIIYVIGSDQGFLGGAKIWKLNLDGSFISSFTLPNSALGRSFTFFNNLIISVGLRSGFTATLWKTSLDGTNLFTFIKLGADKNISYARSIVSLPLPLGPLSLFSSIKSQKGVK